MKIFVRQAEENDVGLLNELYESIGKNDLGYFKECLADENRTIFIASEGKTEGGFCILSWKPKYSLYNRLGIPEIQDINVIPKLRRRGLAGAMIAHCESLARDKKCEHIGISVGLTRDFGPAQILYAKAGFMPDGFGVTYDREPVHHGERRPVDDNLCLMLVKPL